MIGKNIDKIFYIMASIEDRHRRNGRKGGRGGGGG